MQKKFILVGLKNRSLGWDFFKAVLDSLERYSVDLTHIDCVRLRFETPHTKTWFVFKNDRPQWYEGIRADAIFGSQYEMLLTRATSDTFIAHQKGVGLVEYICQVENEAENKYRKITDLCVADMYPPTLFMKPLSQDEKRLYRRILNATYGKYGTFSYKPKILDPGFFKHEEIKPLAKGTNLDGLRKFYPIDEWDSYKEGVMTATWPKTNPYLMSKEDVDRILAEGSKNFVDQQVIYAMGRRNGKTMTCLKYLEKEFEKKEGEKTMNTAFNDLVRNKRAYLVTDNTRVPVLIDTIEVACGEAPSFEGHMLEPTLSDIIDRRVNSFMSKPTKLPGIKTVHFSGPVTAVIWEDKTKTIVRANDGEFIDYEKGLAMAIAKKVLGTNKSGSNYYDIFKKYLPKPEIEEESENG